MVAAIAVIDDFAWLPWYPLWSVTITVSVCVTWNLSEHGRDITRDQKPGFSHPTKEKTVKAFGIIAGVAVVAAVVAVVIYKRDDVGEYISHEYEHLQKQIHDLEAQLQGSKEDKSS